MKQFETVDAVVDMYNRCIESKRVLHNLVQHVAIHIFAKERLCNRAGNLVERTVLHIRNRTFIQCLNPFGHVQALVRSQPFDNSFFQRGERRLMIGTIIFHDNNSFINSSFCRIPNFPLRTENSSKRVTASGVCPGLYIRNGTGVLVCVRTRQGVG